MPKNKKTVALSSHLLGDIEMALNDNSYEMTWYLDIREKKATFLSDMYNENEELRELIEDNEGDRFIPIPAKSSHEGWRQMEEFILSLDDQNENTRNLLLNTIQGRGAFGRFKEAVYDVGLQDRWYEFKNRKDREEALDWLHSLDLINSKQVEEGMQIYEEQLQRRKQREQEIADMTKGVRVTCTDTVGHADKLTIGKEYDVLDEQKQHLNIRIKDDRGKICWLPKSHFALVF